ncbi:hypothetical protein [Domibacillus epiphyticus]|uniref:Uncharacterized protein n=1 Tax=Domibacillus epiphyticus TaxID=1714355 RepID=A0A1V2A6R7_9BACI|nr:hypothetical protein [Domibacillus epiphyticus]OMP66703.1 hypothetical protein BTO28_11760 [Domibacillus epiphyticus]
MEGSKRRINGSLVFLVERNAECSIRMMTMYQEDLIVDAEFMKQSPIMDEEWVLGEKGTIKITAVESGAWKEMLIDYCLKEGYIRLTALSPSYLSAITVSSIANQFFIRKGNSMKFLSARTILDIVQFEKEPVSRITIPTK